MLNANEMKRRQLIKGLAALGLMGAVAPSVIAQQGSALTQASPLNFKQLFNQALKTNANLIGFQGTTENFSNTALSIEGTIPKQLKGWFMRNGPALHQRGNQRYHHLFEGDGMLQRFVIENGRVTHQGQFLQTPKFKREQAAGELLFSGPATQLADGLPVSRADQVNVANTNIIMVNDELWALWEGGSASAVNAKDMSFDRFVNLGEGNQYGDQLKGLPFSAHPRIEANGDIWNFGLNPSGRIVLYHLAGNGKLKNVGMLDSQFKGGMLHDFLITERHLVFILPSLKRDFRKAGLFNAIYFDSQLPMRALVVDKQSLKMTQSYELPAGFVFHFGNAWEDKQGNIRFDASLYKDFDVMQELSSVMRGLQVAEYSHAKTALFTLYKNGKTASHRFDENSEFPRICPHLIGQKNRLLFHTSSSANSIWSNRIVSRNIESGKVQQFDYGEDFLVEEHVPVCPNQKEGEGYLIGTALHVPSNRTCLNFFKMDNVSAGSIARAWLPHVIPLGFHGNFFPVA